MDKRERLRQIINEKSYISSGDFKLASGAESSFFFDMKPTLLDPEGSSLVAEAVLDLIKSKPVDAIAGLELGACPIVSSVCTLSWQQGRGVRGIYVRKTPKKRGTQKLIEGSEISKGLKIVVVDDVTTAGGSVLQAVDALLEFGCEISGLISIVDRLQGARQNIESRGFKFESIYTKDDFI